MKWTADPKHSNRDWIGLYKLTDNYSEEVTKISSQGRWSAIDSTAYENHIDTVKSNNETSGEVVLRATFYHGQQGFINLDITMTANTIVLLFRVLLQSLLLLLRALRREEMVKPWAYSFFQSCSAFLLQVILFHLSQLTKTGTWKILLLQKDLAMQLRFMRAWILPQRCFNLIKAWANWQHDCNGLQMLYGHLQQSRKNKINWCIYYGLYR